MTPAEKFKLILNFFFLSFFVDIKIFIMCFILTVLYNSNFNISKLLNFQHEIVIASFVAYDSLWTANYRLDSHA